MTTTEPITQAPPPPGTEQVNEDLEAVRSNLLRLEDQARSLVRERPVAALLSAIGVGYLVARIFSRRSR